MNERDIFQAAVEIANPSERSSFLDDACQDQPGLRSHVEALLKHHDDAGSFLEKPPAELDRTRLLDEQATDENSLAPTHSPESVMSEETLRSLLAPSETPGVLGTLGQYEVLEKIGQGGMGLVLKAKDTKLERIVAIKLLAPELASNPMARKRFKKEAVAAAAVTHDHVVRIYAVNDHLQVPMLVMECIDGQSLQQKIDRKGALEVKEILRIGLQAALGLAAAHKQGLVHRDIKPANILLENGIERVKITDFGLARAVDDIGMTKTGQITGTPQYMSPEQAQGDLVDCRSDLFSLGSVMYAMCTGRAAFRADSTVAVLRRVCDDQARPIREINPEIPLPLVDIVDQLMEKNPEDRFQSAAEVADVLSELLAQIQQPGGLVAAPLTRSQNSNALAPPPKDLFHMLAWGKLALILAIVLLGFGFSEATGFTRLASTIIRIVNGEGTLVIETNDSSLQVTVEGQGSRQEVRVTGMGVNLTLKPGDYKVTATNKEGESVAQELVTITRNGKNVVRIAVEGSTQEASKGLSDKLQQELALAVRAGRGELSADELKSLKDAKHCLPELLEMPVYRKMFELLAELPAETRKQLIEEGYVKWPHAGLSESYRESFTTIVKMFLKLAEEMDFGGKKALEENVSLVLQNSDVGFAVIDYPESKRAITFFVLIPASPVPLGTPIVPEDPKDFDPMTLGLAQFEQLKKLAEKPDSFYPRLRSELLLNPPRKVSLLKSSRLIVKDGFRPVWMPDGKQVLYSRHGGAPLQIHDLTTGISSPFLSHAELEPDSTEPKSVLDAALSPDGKIVAVVLRPLGKGNQAYFQEEIRIVPFAGKDAPRIMGGYPSFGNDSHVLYFQDRIRNMLCSVRLDEPEARAKDIMPCPGWYPVVSPDGKLVAFTERESLHVFSLEDRKEILSWTCPEPASGMLLSWSPDSKKLGLCPYKDQDHLGFWCFDLETKESTRISEDPIGEVAWSPDGKQLAFTLHEGAPSIYVTSTDQVPKLSKARTNMEASKTEEPDPLTEIRSFKGHSGPVKQMAVSSDGKLAVSGSGWPRGDATVRLWDLENGQEIRTLATLGQAVMAVSFSPDNKQVVAGGFDELVHVWDVSSGHELKTLPALSEVVEDTVFSPDGRFLLCVGHKRAFVSGEKPFPNHGKAVLWNLQSGERLWEKDSNGWLKNGAFSPDGERIFLAGFFTGAEVHVLNSKTGEEIEQFRKESDPKVGVEDLAISPDGESVATALVSGTVRVWRTKPEGIRMERKIDTDRLLAIGYTPNGSHLLTGGAAWKIHVLDAKTLDPVISQEHPSGTVSSLAVCPDSCRFLSAGGTHSEGKTIKTNGDFAFRLWQLPASLCGALPTAHSE